MINPLTPLHGCLKSKQLSWLLKLSEFHPRVLTSNQSLLPVKYYDNHNTDSVTSVTPIATD